MVKAAPQLLEPMMKLNVFAPEEKVGDVIGDLNAAAACPKFVPQVFVRTGRRARGWLGDSLGGGPTLGGDAGGVSAAA